MVWPLPRLTGLELRFPFLKFLLTGARSCSPGPNKTSAARFVQSPKGSADSRKAAPAPTHSPIPKEAAGLDVPASGSGSDAGSSEGCCSA